MLMAGWLAGAVPSSAEDPAPRAKPSAKRPAIGIVLGGGGAKGIAHVGVLRVLEQERIPIDYIAGTSMGALIGGMYASGMSPDEIETMLTTADWWDLMKDRTPRLELPLRRKSDDVRYLLDLELGFNRGKIGVPTGLAAGQKLNNLLQHMTLNAAGLESFDDLNIPFRCVGTDLRTGGEVVLDHGNLARAMRASMAVPGAFTPVEIDDRVLADGGLVNNVPVEVARAMGAEVVIAVPVGSIGEAMEDRDLGSLVGIASQTYLILKRPAEEEALRQAQVVIAPDTSEYSAGDFHQARHIIPLGEAAARQAMEALKPYALPEKEYQEHLARQRRRRLPESGILLSAVTVEGNQRVDRRVIEAQVASRPGETLNFQSVKDDLFHIYRLGDFETVTYELVPSTQGTYALKYLIQEKRYGPGYLRFGLRLRTDFEEDSEWAILLNYTRTRINSLGAEWRNDFQIGEDHRVYSEFYQPLDYAGRLFVAPSVEYLGEQQNIYDGSDKIAEYSVDKWLGRFDLGMAWTKYGELRAGLALGHVRADVSTGDADLPDVDATVGGYTMRATIDRLDKSVFARRGVLAEARLFLARDELASDEEYDQLWVNLQGRASRGNHTLLAHFQGGSSLGSDLPQYARFTIGGLDTLAGLADEQLRGDYFGAGRLGYQYRMGRLSPSMGDGIYLVAWADAGNVWEDSGDISTSDLVYGGLVGVGAETVIGPIYVGLGSAEEGEHRLYFSLGSAF
jgi:NTE family protein